ncbi:MAG: fimbria/pilus periplasmic chaperone [Bacteriovoracaceae bacterium]|nr:fimbria/pilus periplasmic chaperone [Bacteriovoracaceae bacterium]
MTQKLLIFTLIFIFCSGFSLTPMSHVIELKNNEKQAQFLLDNPTSEPMAVEVSLRDRIQKEDGSEETPVTKDLTAYPPQLIVPPKEKRAIRVQWRGEKPKLEKSYRLIAEQLPLQVDGKVKKGSGIKMLLKYVAALYVDPGETSSKLEVIKIEPTDKDLQITVINKGSRHQLLKDPVLVLSHKDEKIKLSENDLKGLAGENLLAGATRIFKIPSQTKVNSKFQGVLKVD